MNFGKLLVVMFLGVLFTLPKDGMSEGQTTDKFDLLSSALIQVCYENRQDVSFEVEVEYQGVDTLQVVTAEWSVTESVVSGYENIHAVKPNHAVTVDVNDIGFSTEGTHTVDVTFLSNGQPLDTVTIVVEILPELISNSLVDLFKCNTDSVSVSAEFGFEQYVWEDGVLGRSRFLGDAGEYRVELINQMGCRANDTVRVYDYPIASLLAPGDTVFCEGEFLTLSVLNGFTGVTWGNGFSGNSVQINSPGAYMVSAMDQHGCLVEDSINIVERAAPNAALISSLTMCEGDTAELITSNNFTSYAWSTGASGSSIQVFETGVYTITVVGDEGCIGYDTASVNVNPLPQIQFSDSTMCNMESIVVDAGAYAQYAWNTGDSTSYLSISTPGIYVVTVVDFNGCEAFDTLNVNNTNVSLQLPNDTTICENTSFNVQLGAGYDLIEWDNGDNSSLHYIGNEGVHEVTVYMGECAATDQFYVNHDPVVIADFEVNVVSPVVYLSNYSNAPNCQWFFGDGNTSSDFEPQYSYQSNGVFEITLVVENTCGTDSITKEAGIFPQAIGNVGIGQHINVFPTISSSLVHFTISDLNYSNVTYMVYDVAGKIIKQKELQYIGERESVDVSNLATGQYFITIGVDDLSAIHTTTFIVE